MTATALDALRRLLHEPGSEPLELAAALAQARAAVTIDPATRWDLDRMELAFLRRQSQRRDATPELRQAVAAASLAELRVETRVAIARADTDTAALFDLAEQRALYRLSRLHDDAAKTLAELQRRLASVAATDSAMEEARERFATLATDEEDLSLDHRILLLEETRAVFASLAECRLPRSDTASESGTHSRGLTAAQQRPRELRRMAARTARMHCDRVLVRRLESLLTPRGARWLEITSLALLAIVFGLLALEAWRDWTPATMRVFEVVDGAICLFFIVEFLLKLSLAPRRTSWFLRHMLTDLLPAIPAALTLTPVSVPTGGDDLVLVRLLRLMRITYFARYLQAMQPLLRLLRLLLFLVKGMDGLMRRFSPLVNRNFVFFEHLSLRDAHTGPLPAREVLFRALRREHLLLAEERIRADAALVGRARLLSARFEQTSADVERPRKTRVIERDVPVETAISTLYGLRVPDLLQLLSLRDVHAVDRVVRVLSAPLVRSLPIIRSFSLRQMPAEPASRVVAFAHRIALYLERWRTRLVFFADLHGIVTGPQLLDRVATAMVKASQRPAVRLLLFGALFFLARAIVGADSGPGLFLKRFVAAPLVILGSVCAVFLSLGWWLKRLAGEASEAFKLTSEARFIGMLDSLKTRREAEDAAFLAQRVFRTDVPRAIATQAILDTMRVVREGRRGQQDAPMPALLRSEAHQTGLLQMHYLDGALMHSSDVKTTEQLLANPSLENVRVNYLRTTARKDRRRLRRLSLSDGSVFSGPYMWFSFITESTAVETAKRVTEYNRHCLTLAQQRFASATELSEYHDWLHRRRLEMSGRTLRKLPPPGKGLTYRTTEFCALDFLSGVPERDEHVEAVFGREVAELLRTDRRRMLREIFGMRPLHRLPPSQRSFNFYVFYDRHLSNGRILLLPLFFVLAFFRAIGIVAGKTAATVREILRPQQAQRRRTSGHAPFTVALRKIHRMKAPGLLEAMRVRAAFDPEYCGAPATWSSGEGFNELSELACDLRFLHLEERQRVEFETIEREMRRHVEACHRVDKAEWCLPDTDDPLERRLRERALTVAWATDRDWVRTLWSARAWLQAELPRLTAKGTRVEIAWLRRAWAWLVQSNTGIDRVLATHFADLAVTRRARRNLRRAFTAGEPMVTALVAAGDSVARGTDWRVEAGVRARRIYLNQHEVTRDLCAVRAVQSLTVLDVRNYRELVFQLGDYGSDGEDPAVARALP